MLAKKVTTSLLLSAVFGTQAYAEEPNSDNYLQGWAALDAAYTTANDDPGFKTRTKRPFNAEMYTDYAKRVGEARERIQIAVAASASFQQQYGTRKEVDGVGRKLLGNTGYSKVRSKQRLKQPSKLIYLIDSNAKRFERNVDGNVRSMLRQAKRLHGKGKMDEYKQYLVVANELSPNDERITKLHADVKTISDAKAAKKAEKERNARAYAERIAQRKEEREEEQAAAALKREQEAARRKADHEAYEAKRAQELAEREKVRAERRAESEARRLAYEKKEQERKDARAAYMATDDATLAKRSKEINAEGKQLRHSPSYYGRDSAEKVSAFILNMLKNKPTAPDYKPQYVNAYIDGDWREGYRKSGQPIEYYTVAAIEVYTDDVISKHDLAYAVRCRFKTRKSPLPRPELPLTGIDGAYSCGSVSYVKLSTHRR